MSGVAPVANVAVAPVNVGAPRGAPAAALLLPAPQLAIGSIESLYALMAESKASQQKSGKVEVERKFAEKREKLEQYKEQLQKAADEKSDGLFKTLATIGMVVAAAAATVLTLGSAAPAVVAVGLALSASGFAVSETKCLDPLLGEGVSSWIGVGLAFCAAICTLGAGSGSLVEAVGKGALAGATVAQGCQKVDETLHEDQAKEYQRDAKTTQHQMRRMQDAIDDMIACLQDIKDSSRRGAEAVNTIVETEGQTLVIAAGGRA